ncbi:MAG: hypothetical protein AAFY19_11545 [Pseudomonadota bacterium]
MDRNTFLYRAAVWCVGGIATLALQGCYQPGPLDSWGDVDPEILADVEAVLAWDGECNLSDPAKRAQVEAGGRVFHAEAVACLVPKDICDGGWERRSEDEQAALLPLLGKHYVLSRDPRLLELGVCDIHPSKRISVPFDVDSSRRRVNIQPFHYALSLPDPLLAGEAIDRFFDCAEWSVERRLQYED